MLNNLQAVIDVSLNKDKNVYVHTYVYIHQHKYDTYVRYIYIRGKNVERQAQ